MLTLMLTASTQRVKQQNERRQNLRRHVRGQGEAERVCAVCCVILRFPAENPLSVTPPPPTTKQKVNFDLDLVTYFLFLVRGLVSYQDEGKCQDGGSATRRR